MKIRVDYSATVGGSQIVEVPDDCADPTWEAAKIVEKSARFRDWKHATGAIDVQWESEEVTP